MHTHNSKLKYFPNAKKKGKNCCQNVICTFFDIPLSVTFLQDFYNTIYKSPYLIAPLTSYCISTDNNISIRKNTAKNMLSRFFMSFFSSLLDIMSDELSI